MKSVKVFFTCLFVLLAGCSTIKPYEKEFLLNPVMDDVSVGALSSSFSPSVYAKYEKISSGTASSSGSTSCPTCGG